MAKLTEEQKAANKVAQKARDRAYNARKREYRAARDAAIEEFKTHPVRIAADQADETARAALLVVEQEANVLRAKIAQLQAEISGLREKHGVEALFETRRTTGDACRAARVAIEDAIDQKYADVSNCDSAVGWAAKGHWPPKA
jgi:hypothetical protein